MVPRKPKQLSSCRSVHPIASGQISHHRNQNPQPAILRAPASPITPLETYLSRFRSALLIVGLTVIATGPGMAATTSTPVARPASPLFHGNWCGIGDLDRGKPVDALDAACRAHDLCYERMGRGACACDRAFLKATASLSQSRRIDDAVKAKAAMANTLFALTPCVENGKSPRRAGKR